MDYNINVTLRSHTTGKATSATKEKRSSTSSSFKRPNKTNTDTARGAISPKGMARAIKGVGIVAGAVAVKKAVTAGANIGADIEGMVTDNRYRQQRDKDSISYMSNPIKMEIAMFKYGIKQHFETQRENKRIEYNIRRSGNSVSTKSGIGGVTL